MWESTKPQPARKQSTLSHPPPHKSFADNFPLPSHNLFSDRSSSPVNFKKRIKGPVFAYIFNFYLIENNKQLGKISLPQESPAYILPPSKTPSLSLPQTRLLSTIHLP